MGIGYQSVNIEDEGEEETRVSVKRGIREQTRASARNQFTSIQSER